MSRDLLRRRGDTFADEFEITSETTGLAIDISSYSFLMTVATKSNPADNSLKLFEITGNKTDSANGLVEFAPTVSDTNRVGVFYYDIQMTDGASRIRTVETGKYEIKQDITK
jgi:hypothetical protein